MDANATATAIDAATICMETAPPMLKKAFTDSKMYIFKFSHIARVVMVLGLFIVRAVESVASNDSLLKDCLGFRKISALLAQLVHGRMARQIDSH